MTTDVSYANEKPKGETVPYEQLLQAWSRNRGAYPPAIAGMMVMWSCSLTGVSTGVFERLDLAGLDTMVAVLRGAGRPVPSLLAEKVERGELGLKSGRGFYVWTPEAIAAFEERVARHLSEQLRKDQASGLLPTPSAEEEP